MQLFDWSVKLNVWHEQVNNCLVYLHLINHHSSCQIVLTFCTGHGSTTAVLFAKCQNDWATATQIMCKWNFVRFVFTVTFRKIFYLYLSHSSSMLQSKSPASGPVPFWDVCGFHRMSISQDWDVSFCAVGGPVVFIMIYWPVDDTYTPTCVTEVCQGI